MNNYNNWSEFQSSAKPTVYVSFIKSETHYFLGYWLYFARACSGYPLIKTMNCMSKQSNIMTGVLLVVRHQNQGGLGTLEYMQTIAWDDSQHYLPAGSQLKLMGGMATLKGDIQFEDGKKRSPLIFVRHGDHAAFGDKSFTAGIGHWHKDGFPENSGIIYRYFSGNSKTPSDDNDPSARYQMKFLYNDLWSLRKNFGSNNMFSTFGILRTSKSDNQNIAPWAYKDTDYGHRPRGEIFYNPIDLIRHEFPMGWTNFSFKYLYNPYALRLELEKLTVLKDNDIGIGVGESDPFIAIYAFDRDGKEYRILGDRSQIKVSSNYGYRIDAMQNTWRKDDVKANTVLDLGKEMGRNYFYYLKVPNFSHFNLAVREYDAMTLNDWLMDPELQHREKSSIPGQVQRSLDFIESKLEFKYGCVTGSNCQ